MIDQDAKLIARPQPDPIDAEVERPKFEAWASAMDYTIDSGSPQRLGPVGKIYFSMSTRCAFDGWLAAKRDAAEQEAKS